MGTLIMVAQLLLGISIIVGLHEFGHLITAKIFGMRVEKFSIGFPPKIFSFRWGETEYAIGAIPLGGFVKISGMIDESFDTQHLKEAPKDYEFRSKPAWQRLIVMMGGILINIITGIMMFIGLLYLYGKNYMPIEKVKHGIIAHELGQELGLETGDKIIGANGKKFEKFDEVLSPDILLASESYYLIERNEKEKKIKIPNDFVEKLSLNKDKRFIEIAYKFEVEEVLPKRAASKAGLKEGDKIIAFNDKKIEFFQDFQEEQFKHKNKAVELTVLRNGQEKKLSIKSDTAGYFGFYPKFFPQPEHLDFSFAESVVKGTTDAFGSVFYNIQGFAKIFKGEVSLKSVSGPIGIVKAFSPTWNWYGFWRIVGILSMWLAFVNFLPIPALDGGHVMFLLYEMISGRKPSDKFLQNAQGFGVILLLILMAFILFNDIFNLFF